MWDLKNSPLVSMHERTIGGITTIFLGEPGAGKTRASYQRAWRLYRRERLFIRGLSKNHIWHWRFGRRAVVWVPEGTVFRLLAASESGGREIPVKVQVYRDYADLLSRAKLGNANVLYWGSEGLTHWGEFLAAILQRPDRLPQLILDDEVQAVAPDGATNADGSYTRVRDLREWMREARESEVSTLLSTQIDFQMDFNMRQLAHFYVFMAGAGVPERVRLALRGMDGRSTYLHTRGLPPGRGYVVGRTPEGYRYQPVNFRDRLKVGCKTISLVMAPPEAPKLTGKQVKMKEEKESIEKLLSQGLTQAQVAKRLRMSPRTVWSRISQVPTPPPLS
jgi:predicted DNA-binding protein (UPF0251 family)